MILLYFTDVFLRIADFVNFGRCSLLVTVGLNLSPYLVRHSVLPAHGSCRRKGRALKDCGQVVTDVGETMAEANTERGEFCSQQAENRIRRHFVLNRSKGIKGNSEGREMTVKSRSQGPRRYSIKYC